MSDTLIELLTEINACTAENAGGIAKIECLPIEWILSFPLYVTENNEMNTAITLKGGFSWLPIPILVESAGYKEDQSNSDHKSLYNALLSANVPKDISNVSALFNRLRRHRFIVRYTDKNGFVKIVGTPTYPLAFLSKLSTGNSLSQLNGHTITFSGKLLDKAPFYTV
jgi:hypothetical protein